MMQPIKVGDELGGVLKAARIYLNRTQVEIAEAANLTQSALSSIETGRRTPGVEVIIRICRALGVTLYVGLKLGNQSNAAVPIEEWANSGLGRNDGGATIPGNNPPIIR
jgi:transcriptional regulator with XRE-family HTH domain